VNEKKDYGDDNPENGKGEEDAAERLPESKRYPGPDA
jgi:hypothetical protein